MRLVKIPSQAGAQTTEITAPLHCLAEGYREIDLRAIPKGKNNLTFGHNS